MINSIWKYTALVIFMLCIFSCSKNENKDKSEKIELNQPAGKLSQSKPEEKEVKENEEAYQKALKNAAVLLEFESVNKKINISLKADQNIKIEGALPSEVQADGSIQEIFIAKNIIPILGEVKELKIHDADILKGVNVQNAQKLRLLDISFSGLQKIDFENCPSLESLILEHNKKLNMIDVLSLSSIKELSVKASPISELVLPADSKGNLSGLKALNCAETKIKKIDFSLFPELEYLDISSSSFDSIDLKKNINLKKFYCENAGLTSLDLSQNKKLTELKCRGNRLPDLALFQNKELERLDCGKNELDKLLVNFNTKLKSLYCDSNRIKELDISSLKRIEELYCHRNKIEKILLNSNANLKTIFCFENDISEKYMLQLFNSLKEGDGYDVKTLVVYAEKNPGLTYKSDTYFDHNFIPTDEMLASSYFKFWKVYFTLYGLEDMGSILDSLVQKNKAQE